MSALLVVALTEFRLGARNRWVVLATLVLFSFALVLGLLGSAPVGTVDAAPLAVVVASLATLSVYLVPLIALLVSFDTLAGEVERGTLALLFATPTSRAAVLLGKCLGQSAVVALSVALGYGVAGGAILALTGGGAAEALLVTRLVGLAAALGAVFVALGTALSGTVRQCGTAAALAVAVWLAAVVLWDLALLGALVAAPERVAGVFPYLLLANPADAFRLVTIAALDLGAASELSGIAEALPFAPGAAAASLAAWFFAALGGAALIVGRMEP